VRVKLVQQNDRLRIKIQDWGVGLNPNVVDENRFGLAGLRERARLLGGQHDRGQYAGARDFHCGGTAFGVEGIIGAGPTGKSPKV
jgi:glucose-6-phosphate-specific signal transduction histidine kinase